MFTKALNPSAIDALPPGVVVVRSEPTLRRQVYAVWRTDATRRSAIRAAVEAFEAAAQV